MKQKPTISGFFPFLNDWGTIGSLVATLDSVLKEQTSNYEIIIVDDGSDYRSKELLKFLANKFPKLRIITHRSNKGYGGAIKSGIKHSKMEWVFYTDGDAQYDPRDLRNLLKYKREGVDIVNGYKIKRADPWYRIIAGKTYHYFVKLLFQIPIRDTDCDFRLMRRSMFRKIELESDSGLICAEMIKKIDDFGFTFQEVAVNHYWRTSGKSQFFNFRRVGKVVLGLLVLWYNLVIKKSHINKKLEGVVDLHLSQLNDSFLSNFGREFLLHIYQILVSNKNNSLITISRNKKVVGFLLATKDSTKMFSLSPYLIFRSAMVLLPFFVNKPILAIKLIAFFLTPKRKNTYRAELQFIAVDKNYQNKGIGKRLLKQLQIEFKHHKIKKFRVGTKTNNAASNNFYKHLGFKYLYKDKAFGENFNFYLSPPLF